MSRLHESISLALLLAGGPVPPPLAAQDAGSAPGPAFVFARYSGRSAHALYGGYQVGPVLFLAGMLQNPRTGYGETLGGAGVALALAGGAAVTAAGAVAYASDGWYGQIYLLPSISVGRFSLAGTVELYQPLEPQGARQFYVTPGTGLLSLTPGLAIGASYLLSTQRGADPGHALGPAIRIGLPRATLTLAGMRGWGAAPHEIRLYFFTSL